MKKAPGILICALSALVCMVIFSSCTKEKPDYEALANDLIGVWCDVDGPEYVNDGTSDPYHRFYEFYDGTIYYYMPTETLPMSYTQSYTLRDDLLDVEGSKCRITIENDILTMITADGESKYRRMDAAEICDYGVIAANDEIYVEQLEILGLAETAPKDNTDSGETVQ